MRLEHAPARRPRPTPRVVEQHVVLATASGEVVAGVVDHVIGAERSRLLDISRAAYGGDLRSERLGDLHGERSHAAGCAVHEDLLFAAVIDPILDAGATAEEFVSDALSPALLVGLDQGVRDKLILGIRRFMGREEARSVGQPLGIALEDFLRGIAHKHSIDVSTKHGIGQVGTELRGHGKITKRHLGLIESANSLRIAIEHGEDADEGKDWQITAQGLRLLISTTMLGIKSISSYDERGDLDL